jgi:hypothetical protein
VACNLILPKGYEDRRLDNKVQIKECFQKDLEAFVDRHQSVKEPYFILVKANPDRKTNFIRSAMTFYGKRPPFITRTIVFLVDNSRGLITWLWRVTPEKQVIFNKEFAKSCQEIIKKASPASTGVL